MNTQSHILMGALIFGRKVPRAALAGALGGFAPDLSMLSIVAGLKFNGTADHIIFGTMYWEHWWQVANAISHSFLLWSGLLAVSFVTMRRQPSPLWPLVAAFAGAALLHSVIDFLVHREDAHMQFWPFSDWKFVSPVSYWDPAHYGRMFSLGEAALGIVMAIVLFRQYRNWITRGLLILALAIYAVVPAYFIWHH